MERVAPFNVLDNDMFETHCRAHMLDNSMCTMKGSIGYVGVQHVQYGIVLTMCWTAACTT